MKIIENIKLHFKSLKSSDYIIIGFLGLIVVLAYYFSISFSVKLSSGYTLFGDSSTFDNSVMETKGPTSSDISVLILFWVLTAILTGLFIYVLFFKKPNTEKIVKKEIVDGKTVIVKGEENDKQ